MFNAEKILGGLLMGGSRRRGGLGSLMSGGAALGLVGIAMEAVEHYMGQSKASGPGQPPPVPPPGRDAPPPPSALPGTSPRPSTPPPPPGGMTPPDVVPGVHGAEEDPNVILLIRAMIAAANADGVIDQDERARILGKLETMNLSSEEHSFIVRELLAPVSMEKIVTSVKTRETARQVYTVSLLTIEIDTDAERAYINTLARELSLDESDIAEIHKKLGIEKPDVSPI
jgi:uncharacterized membrane protein YebE (DUF533 family)